MQSWLPGQGLLAVRDYGKNMNLGPDTLVQSSAPHGAVSPAVGVPLRASDLYSECSLHFQACPWKTKVHCRSALLQPGNNLLSQRRQVSLWVPSAGSQCSGSFPSPEASALLGSLLEMETLKPYPVPRVVPLEWTRVS